MLWRVAVLVGTLMVGFHTPARAVPLFDAAAKCQQQIGKQAYRFRKTVLGAMRRCFEDDAVPPGCDSFAAQAAFNVGIARFKSAIEKRCSSSNLFLPQTGGIGFSNSCTGCPSVQVTDVTSLAE